MVRHGLRQARTNRCTFPSCTTAPGLNTSFAAHGTRAPVTGHENVTCGSAPRIAASMRCEGSELPRRRGAHPRRRSRRGVSHDVVLLIRNWEGDELGSLDVPSAPRLREPPEQVHTTPRRSAPRSASRPSVSRPRSTKGSRALPHFNPDDDVEPLPPACRRTAGSDPGRRCVALLDTGVHGRSRGRSRTCSTGRSATTNPARSTRSRSRGSTRRLAGRGRGTPLPPHRARVRATRVLSTRLVLPSRCTRPTSVTTA